MALTKKQQDVLNFILGFMSNNHRPPAIREIAAKFGIASPNGVVGHLEALRRKGYIMKPDKDHGSWTLDRKRFELTISEV